MTIVVRLIREGPFFFLLCWSKVCGLILAIDSKLQFRPRDSSTAGIHKEEYKALVLHSLYKFFQFQIYRISNIVPFNKIQPILKLEMHAAPSTSIWRWVAVVFLTYRIVQNQETHDSRVHGKSKSRNSCNNYYIYKRNLKKKKHISHLNTGNSEVSTNNKLKSTNNFWITIEQSNHRSKWFMTSQDANTIDRSS